MTDAYKLFLKDRQWLRSTVLGFFFLLLSFMFSILSGRYASSVADSHPVSDILLDQLPRFNVTALHIYAASIFWLGIMLICILKPKFLPFSLKATAIFLTIRSLFVVMTHLGPPENFLEIPKNITSLYIYNGDLFFSGHVGGPFLFALIFWEVFVVRIVCILASIFFSVVVLLGGLHYTIDVFSSYFIAHSIFHFSKKYMPVDIGF